MAVQSLADGAGLANADFDPLLKRVEYYRGKAIEAKNLYQAHRKECKIVTDKEKERKENGSDSNKNTRSASTP